MYLGNNLFPISTSKYYSIELIDIDDEIGQNRLLEIVWNLFDIGLFATWTVLCTPPRGIIANKGFEGIIERIHLLFEFLRSIRESIVDQTIFLLKNYTFRYLV